MQPQKMTFSITSWIILTELRFSFEVIVVDTGGKLTTDVVDTGGVP
jgi:hypothetical protein